MKPFVFLLIFVGYFFSELASAAMVISAQGHNLYSRIEYQNASSTFSLLSDAGSGFDGEFSMGGSSFDIFGTGRVNNYSFKAPSSRTLTSRNLQTFDAGGGMRFKSKPLWIFLKAEQKESVQIEASDAGYKPAKKAIQMAKGGFKIFAWGPGYTIVLEGEAGIPVNQPVLASGEKLRYSYTTEGVARIEFGSSFKISTFVGFGAEQYKGDGSYFKTDFFGGIGISFGMFSGGGRSETGSGNSTPRYPL